MSDDPKDSDWKPTGPALSADGTLEGRIERLERIEEPQPRIEPEAPLELDVRAPSASEAAERVAAAAKALRRRPRRKTVAMGVVIAGVVVGVAIIGVSLLLKPVVRAERQAATPLRVADTREEAIDPVTFDESTELPTFDFGSESALVIDSQPQGAEVRINGELVGVTPWAGDDRFGNAPRVELKRSGFAPWVGTPIRKDDRARVGARLRPLARK